MNLTSQIEDVLNVQNSTGMIIESWFIPFDILLIICSILIILLSIVFLLIIILDKTCHTISMLLIINTSLSGLIMGCILLSFSMFTLENDLRQIEYEDSFCIIRAYIGYVSYTLFNFSFTLQSIYRYMIVVYPTRLFYQSSKFQVLMICLIWIFSFVCCIPFLSSGEIVYNSDNQICQLRLRFSFIIIYGTYFVYTMPLSFIIFIYWKLVRYVKEMSKHVTPVNTLFHVKRELKMVRRVVILVTILILICFPYILIMLMSFFNRAPKYHFRIVYIFFDTAVLTVMIVLCQFTDPIKISIIKRIKRRPNTIVAVIT
jgi:hypothetical protein